MTMLENSFYRFSINPVHGNIDLFSIKDHLPDIRSGSMHVELTTLGKFHKVPISFHNRSDERIIQSKASKSGLQCQYDFGQEIDSLDLHFDLSFALPHEYPLFLWRIKITNLGTHAVHIGRIVLLEAGTSIIGMESSIQFKTEESGRDLAFYSNGWHSWSYSAAYGTKEFPRKPLLRFIPNAACTNPGTSYPNEPGHYGSDFYGILGDRKARTALLVGFLSQKAHFGSIEAWTGTDPGLHLWADGDGARLDPGRSMETDWAVIQTFDIDQPDPLAPFLECVAIENDILVNNVIHVGWCSWYQYFTKVSSESVEDNLKAIVDLQPELPLNLVQIDDGFQSNGGDWFDFSRDFPDGLASLAGKIRDAGLQPGLWLAPFIASRGSKLIREHPEYILKNAAGCMVNAGIISNEFSVSLDISHPGALEYTSNVIHHAAHQWGFAYLKLDFLYAGALLGNHYDPTRTRAQILRQGLEALRSAAGVDTYLLGCGVPLGSALGLFESMRISPDVNIAWKPKLFGMSAFIKNDKQLPSVFNALHNTLTRSAFHKRWWINDPDCLLIRPETDLTLSEVQTAATVIGLSGGSLLLSDNLPALPPERLRIAKILLPIIGKRPEILDWFDKETPQYIRLDLSGAVGEWSL
ncbi:MAG: alpha-galactosidase, partial [Anaerolineaceae bacterium]|nr:alpha-galactosidase [Anaerolineaceae bacterium]